MMNRRNLGILIAAVVVFALVGGLFAWAGTRRGDEIVYVTAAASRGTVAETFTTSGTATLDDRATLTFDQPGTVELVRVRVGDPVKAGDTIAALDPGPLHLSVLQARAQLLAARARLDADRAAMSGDGSTGLGGMGLGMSGTAGSPSSGGGQSGMSGLPDFSGMGGEPPPEMAQLQNAMEQLQWDMVAQQQACAPVMDLLNKIQGGAGNLPTLPQVTPTADHTQPPTPSESTPTESTPTESRPSESTPTVPSQTPTDAPTGAESPDPTPSPSAPVTPTPTTIPTPTAVPTELPPDLIGQIVAAISQIQGCLAATTSLAQSQLVAGQAMQGAGEALAQTQTDMANQLQKAGEQMIEAASAAGRQAAEQAMAEAERKLAEQAQLAFGGQVTDATIASDRLSVLQAQQQLDRAERQLASGTMFSPIDGVVGALDLVAGESSAGRSAVIVGSGGASVSIEIPLSVRSFVVPGMDADVGPVAQPLTLAGKVTSVSVVPSSPTGEPTFTAVVFVPDPDQTFANGVRADVALQLRRSEDALFIPASALTRTSDTAGTVEVVTSPTDASAQTVVVETGAAGGGRVEITSGLTEGQLVVLADRRLPVPGDLMQYQAMRATTEPTPSPTP